MYRLFYLLFFVLMMFLWSGCFTIQNQYKGIAPGYWRGILKLESNFKPLVRSTFKTGDAPKTMEEVTAGELPFVFEVKYDTEQKFHIELINGDERIKLDDITLGLDRKTAKDTLVIRFPEYETYLKAIVEGGVMEGYWVVPSKQNYAIPFVAKNGEKYRFTELNKPPIMDISGKWETTFEVDSEKPTKAIGEFKQKDNYLTGTFLTETGDYRYLEGTVQADKLYLSCFDGAHAFLFEGKIQKNNNILGTFRSGMTYSTIWEAVRNESFELTDPDAITYMKDKQQTISFALPNPDGNVISPTNSQYDNKVKIIQIMGTWCPNCRDETVFLLDYLRKNPTKNVAILGLAFERHKDKAAANHAIQNYKAKMNIPYEVVVAGYADKQDASSVLHTLNGISAFPTLIFLDKKNKVRRIHTGFSGPATSKYANFVRDFDAFVNLLNNE